MAFESLKITHVNHEGFSNLASDWHGHQSIWGYISKYLLTNMEHGILLIRAPNRIRYRLIQFLSLLSRAQSFMAGGPVGSMWCDVRHPGETGDDISGASSSCRHQRRGAETDALSRHHIL